MKVYCYKCEYYIPERHHLSDKCLHPTNFRDSYKAPNSIFKANPAYLNFENNCTLFEEKPEPIKKKNFLSIIHDILFQPSDW